MRIARQQEQSPETTSTKLQEISWKIRSFLRLRQLIEIVVPLLPSHRRTAGTLVVCFVLLILVAAATKRRAEKPHSVATSSQSEPVSDHFQPVSEKALPLANSARPDRVTGVGQVKHEHIGPILTPINDAPTPTGPREVATTSNTVVLANYSSDADPPRSVPSDIPQQTNCVWLTGTIEIEEVSD